MLSFVGKSIHRKRKNVKSLKDLLDSFSKLPFFTQLLLVLGFFALLMLVGFNPAVRVAITGFLLTIKMSLGKLPLVVQVLLVVGFFALLIMIILNPMAEASISQFLLAFKGLLIG